MVIPLWWMVLWKQKIHHRGGEGLEGSHMTVEEKTNVKVNLPISKLSDQSILQIQIKIGTYIWILFLKAFYSYYYVVLLYKTTLKPVSS
jgi:hypothetical protein